jgi:uncharacterized cupredoxin-like copper-binding protein
MRRPLAAAVPLAVLAATGYANATPQRVHAKTTRVDVVAKDFSFALSRKSVPRGRVTFRIRDAGHADHDFAIAGRTSKTIAPGMKTTLTVDFAKDGSFPYRCTVDGHADLGMKGVLHVSG